MRNSTANICHNSARFDLSCFSKHKKFRVADIGGNLNIQETINNNRGQTTVY